jgi:hypothetical protein
MLFLLDKLFPGVYTIVEQLFNYRRYEYEKEDTFV